MSQISNTVAISDNQKTCPENEKRQVLGVAQLVNMYNEKFVIEEEMDVMSQVESLLESPRYAALKKMRNCVNYLINLGEFDYDPELAVVVQDLYTRYLNLQDRV